MQKQLKQTGKSRGQQVSSKDAQKAQPTRSGLHHEVEVHQTLGNHGVLRRAGLPAQAKLTIGSSNDSREQEAEHMAEKVMGMSDPQIRNTSGPDYGHRPDVYHVVPDILSSPGEPLGSETRSFFETRFGHTLSHVRLHTGVRAAQSALELSAGAYTIGNHIVLAREPTESDSTGRKMLAHELAHTLQPGHGGQTIRRYTIYDSASQTGGSSLGWLHPSGDDLNVADDGTMAVGDSGSDAWATTRRITSSEQVLKSIDSEVKLEEGSGTIGGKAPNDGKAGRKRTLKEVQVVNRVGGGRADLTADCGTTARQVLGIDSSGEEFAAVMRRKGVERYTESYDYFGNPYTTPQRWAEDIYKIEFGTTLTGAEATAKYENLSAEKRKKFDKKYGINQYAAPNVGQAMAENLPSGWNFHFAGVILKGGADYVTTENFPGPGRDSQSWYFSMYGPRSKGQTFHDVWSDTLGSTAMVVESVKVREGKISLQGVYLVGNPSSPDTTKLATLDKGTEVDIVAKGSSWCKVDVVSGAHAGKTGWIMKKYYETR